jgi:hypothetical protein
MIIAWRQKDSGLREFFIHARCASMYRHQSTRRINGDAQSNGRCLGHRPIFHSPERERKDLVLRSSSHFVQCSAMTMAIGLLNYVRLRLSPMKLAEHSP